MPKFVFLWTDVFLFCLLAGGLIYAFKARRSVALRAAWLQVGRRPSAMCAAMVLGMFVLVGLLDSVHYRPLLAPVGDKAAAYSPVLRSALDDILAATQMSHPEATYSEPLAIRQFTKETQLIDDKPVRDYPRLKHAGRQLVHDEDRSADVRARLFAGLAWGAGVGLLAGVVLVLAGARREGSMRGAWQALRRGETDLPWRAMWLSFFTLAMIAGATIALSLDYHVLGTDRTGNDVLRQGLKSVRTALVIGTLTTLAMLPPALLFGISAGYFRGWVDDVIQYIYTTLTSIPGVLLIAACVLMMQVYIDNNPDLFTTVATRADLRLFLLCLILGLTGWAGLCRMLRAETMKLRELEYVQAARAFGLGPWRIMLRHILPNVMHIILITMVLEFSGLVLYEAVLSYLGIGVDPSTPSFGTMIDAARLEMSRDPMVWWNLLTAFAFLLALVLSANILSDAVQDAFDPRARAFRPLRPRRGKAPPLQAGDGA